MAKLDDLVLDRTGLEALARAYAEKKTGAGIVLFIGSGPSTEAGLPNWIQLREKLTSHAEDLLKKQIIRESMHGKRLAKLKIEDDHWKAFSDLKLILGATTFPEQIRRWLTPESGIKIPAIYKQFLSLDIVGVVSVNLDDLMLKSFSEYSRRVVKPVFGFEIIDKLEILTNERPFFLQMHGNIAAEKTWVLTEEDRLRISSSEAHKAFLQSVFFTNTVLFIGINPDDISVGAELVKLRQSALPTPPHYWITPDVNVRRRDWAEANGIRQIVYSSRQGHSEPLDKILRYIRSFRSDDVFIDRPAINISRAQIIEREPSALARLENVDDIRKTLNGLVLERLKPDGTFPFDEYLAMCAQYRRAVAQAYLTPEGDSESWFDYMLQGASMGGRTFGNVYSALSPQGETVAIKILQEKMYQDRGYLSSFRRGAEALRILHQHAVSGVANLRESYELPPTLVMDFEIGASLGEVVALKKVPSDMLLNIVLRCAEIVQQAHLLPDTVMHRDLKPSNILVRNFSWEDYTYEDVVVFDFELGWYKGASGEEVTRTDQESLGFRAPELISGGMDFSGRSTLVDSFGIGSTLYFCISGLIPSPGASQAESWPRRVTGACERAFAEDSVSIYRCARLILSCTSLEQTVRPDLSLVVSALRDLSSWRSGSTTACSTQFIAEAVVAIAAETHYDWNGHEESASFLFQNGMAIKARFDTSRNSLIVEFSSRENPLQNRRNVDNRLSELPAMVAKHADKLGGVFQSSFTGRREIEGKLEWEAHEGRRHVKEIGILAKEIGSWLGAA